LLSACASNTLIRDQDYGPSVKAARAGHFEKALQQFPAKEEGGFITSIERAWLTSWRLSDQDLQTENGLILLHDRLDDLQKQIATFEDRKFISLSRESKYFLFQESEEGYVPSEPEITVLHLISAQFFLKLGQTDDAKVELRRANFILQGAFDLHQNHFDDPALRVWSGSLWLALGDWQEAQVDFRKAAELSGNERLKKLSELKKPPAKLELIFSGATPEIQWSESSWQPLFLEDKDQPSISYAVHLSTSPWYTQQLQRNTELRNLMMKSNYMAQSLSVKTSANSKRFGGHVLTTTMEVAGILIVTGAVAGGLYLLGSSAEGGAYLIGLGFVGGGALLQASEREDERLHQQIDDSERSDFQDLRTYRFVRFLPQWISAAWVRVGEENAHPLVMAIENEHILSPGGVGKTNVIFGFRPQ
jgi:hypothetical protein